MTSQNYSACICIFLQTVICLEVLFHTLPLPLALVSLDLTTLSCWNELRCLSNVGKFKINSAGRFFLPQETEDRRMPPLSSRKHALLSPYLFPPFQILAVRVRFSVSNRVSFQSVRFRKYSGTPTQYTSRVLLRSSYSRCCRPLLLFGVVCVLLPIKRVFLEVVLASMHVASLLLVTFL